MAKPLVIGAGDGSAKIPFLRGILTRSLQEAGLSFDDAYALSSEVRQELRDTGEITTDELRQVVVKHIAEFGQPTVQRYVHTAADPGTFLVRDSEGNTSQFSRKQHRETLESSGLSHERSTEITSTIFGHLMERRVEEMTSRELGLLTYRYIRLTQGHEMARRYLVLVDFFRGNRPLMLLIGGAPGTGKSAVGTGVAHQLDIARVQSTDLLREVMRMMVPEGLLPILHKSSYDAWEALPEVTSETESRALLIDGYRSQANLLTVPCEAVIRRSIRERASLILEGVHVHHQLVGKIPSDSGAIVVPIVLAVLKREQLRSRFQGRGRQVTQRRAERYLESFESIWQLQSYILSEADRWQTSIIVNNSREQVVRDVMKSIVDTLLVELTAEPQEVFK